MPPKSQRDEASKKFFAVPLFLMISHPLTRVKKTRLPITGKTVHIYSAKSLWDDRLGEELSLTLDAVSHQPTALFAQNVGLVSPSSRFQHGIIILKLFSFVNNI